MSGSYNSSMWSGKWLGDKDHWVVEIKEIGLRVGVVNHGDTAGT